MITIYVEHYLNDSGKDFFTDWIERVKAAISTSDGFISRECRFKIYMIK